MAENQNPKGPLPPGSPAPGFDLPCTADQKICLSDFKGKPLILAFYPADWSPVCGDQMALYNQILPEFHKAGAEILGVSVDGAWCHQAFSHDRNLHFPLLADFEPKGAMSKAYGVYHEQTGVSERALFVIDKEGIIQWSYVSPMGVNPGADGILNALDDMKKKDAAQAEVKSGEGSAK